MAKKAIALAKMSGAEVRLVSVMPGFGMPIVASYVTDDVRKRVTEKVKEAQALFDEQKYDDALLILADVVEGNPERIDQAITIINNAFNTDFITSNFCLHNESQKSGQFNFVLKNWCKNESIINFLNKTHLCGIMNC